MSHDGWSEVNQRIKPKMIIFEHKHLNEKNKLKCIKFLNKNNYKIKFWEEDAFCCLKV